MTVAKTKIRDLLVIRQYYINGINLLVRVDFVKKKMTFVEPSSNGNGYIAKKWLFEGREPEYLRTWVLILDAMKKATDMVVAELNEIKESEFKQTVKALAAMSSRDGF
jgi:hypothetical protein